MAETMTASDHVTDGQIEDAVAKFRSALLKHRKDFSCTAFQQALGVKNLGMKVLAPLSDEVERFSKIVCRTVTVDRTLSPEAAITATGRRQYVTNDVISAMPTVADETVTIEFVQLEKWLSDQAVDVKLAEFGLVAVDPFALAALNAAFPDFASERPCFTHWQDSAGNWCYAAFDVWNGERDVLVHRSGLGWDDCWWAAGVRK